MSPLSLRRYRAERLLAKEFTGMRSKVLAIVRFKLRGHAVKLNAADLEACYAQAWQGLYAAVLEGEQIDNPSGWLVVATLRRALDESDARARRPAHDLEEQPIGFDPDIDGALEARARLAHVFEGLRSRLSERERSVASLCYLQGLSRAEAATRMGISEARVRKLMDGVSPSRPGVAGKVGELLDSIGADKWCEEQSSLMRAFAFGILDREGDRYALAVAHCRECPACRAHVASLRGLAAVLPPLPISLLLAGGAGVGTVGLSGGTASPAAPAAGGGLSSSLGGSIALRLAASGLIALGGGYAALGGLAHGRPSRRSPFAAPVSVASNSAGGRFASSRQAQRKPVRTSRHGARLVHAPRRARAIGNATREFGPEQVFPGALVSSRSSQPAARRNATGAGREFGFE